MVAKVQIIKAYQQYSSLGYFCEQGLTNDFGHSSIFCISAILKLLILCNNKMYLNLIVTEGNRDKNRKPKEDQIKDVENKERKNPQAKKETDPGKFQHSNITFIKILQWKLRWILFPTRTKKRVTTTTKQTQN